MIQGIQRLMNGAFKVKITFGQLPVFRQIALCPRKDHGNPCVFVQRCKRLIQVAEVLVPVLFDLLWTGAMAMMSTNHSGIAADIPVRIGVQIIKQFREGGCFIRQYHLINALTADLIDGKAVAVDFCEESMAN